MILEVKLKLKEIQNEMNNNKPPPMHATFTVETLHLPKDYSSFFVVFAGFFVVFGFF